MSSSFVSNWISLRRRRLGTQCVRCLRRHCCREREWTSCSSRNSTMRRFTAPRMNIFTFERFPISPLSTLCDSLLRDIDNRWNCAAASARETVSITKLSLKFYNNFSFNLCCDKLYSSSFLLFAFSFIKYSFLS